MSFGKHAHILIGRPGDRNPKLVTCRPATMRGIHYGFARKFDLNAAILTYWTLVPEARHYSLKTPPMKLLFVLPEYGTEARGGIATFYNHFLPGLAQAGCAIDVCLPRSDEVPDDLKKQSDVRVFCPTPKLVVDTEARLTQFSAVPDLRRDLARSFAAFRACNGGAGYDAVQTTDWMSLYVPWLVNDVAPPVTVQLHGSSGQVDFYDPYLGHGLNGLITRLLETALLGRADDLQGHGPGNAADWSRLLKRDVCHIWPSFYREDRGNVTPAGDLDAENKGIVVGRIQNWKGPETVCRAIQLVGTRAPAILWVGKDSAARRYQGSLSAFLARAYPTVWGEAILPIGEQPRDVVAGLQSAAKFVLVPSGWDNFNFGVAEAMSAGKVVICSDGAGASGLIRHGESGFRFPADDFCMLADVLIEVANLSPDARRKIGQAAQATIAHEMDRERICALRIDRYRHLKQIKTSISAQQPCQPQPWLNSFFDSDIPEPAFEFLSVVPTKPLTYWTLQKYVRRLRKIFRGATSP